MALAFRFSCAQGLCSGQDAERATRALAAAGLPTALAEIAGHPFAADRLVRHMAQDKKAEGGRLTFILARGIGEAFVAKDLDAAAVRDFLIHEGATP
jgi:3-dehydroquinate synthase